MDGRATRILVVLMLTFVVVLSTGIRSMLASEPAGRELDDVWRQVQQSGAYRFSADIVQTTIPHATVANAGRGGKTNQLYLEGATDLNAETLSLSMWSQGGSVLNPDGSLEIRVDSNQARARTPGGEWEAIDNFTGLFAPSGDFLSYTQSADNVIRHATEIRDTAQGKLRITRYSFDIDGQRFANVLQRQMAQQAVVEGLPAMAQAEISQAYAEMTGSGELWVREDGLPLRQTFTLQFPAGDNGDSLTAEATVNFSGFAATVSTPWNVLSWLTGNGPIQIAASAARGGLSLLTVALGLFMLVLMVGKRRTRIVYSSVVISVCFSMVTVPLLTNQRIYAYSVDQHERNRQQTAQSQAEPSMAAALQADEVDPHADPLAQVTTRTAALADDDSGPYYDPLCVNDPTGDEDGDTLTNLSECLLGTLPTVLDTDQDGLNDNVEVAGGKVSGSNELWYTNPLLQDSNNDSLADGKEWYVGVGSDNALPDTDGDGTPDVWDDDNDGDGVRDNLDLSPYLSTKADVAKQAKTFTASEPLELVIDDLENDKLVKVEFQLAPTDADHLRYTQNILDWPLNDRQGQLQDADGKTFFDVDSTVAPNPNDNGDVRLVPMLEIEIPGSIQSLPAQDLLTQFGISVQEVVTGTWAAYVPLQLVTDSVGDNNVAFYGRMYYQLDDAWGAAQNVRLVWAVQMLNDICSAYENNVCSAYSQYNELQVVQTYPDDYYLTGLNVTEEHGADIALIYEDPAVIGSVSGAPAEYDKPFYMDTLYGLLYGLDSTFLAGADCQQGYSGPGDPDGTDTCTPDGKLDVTVDAIYTRFNHTANSGISEQKRWNLPNVLSVEKNEYVSIDVGMLETTITNTLQLLDTNFTSHWSASDPITPTVMLAHEQSYRGLNMDEALSGDGNLGWSGNGLTVKLPSSGDAAVSLDTMASVKWTPYTYSTNGGWVAAAMDSYYDDLSAQLGTAFSSITDPDQASTQQTMAQLIYVAAYGGDANVVQIDDQVISYNGAQPDEPVAISLTAKAGNYLAQAVNQYFAFSSDLEEIADSLPDGADFEVVVSEYLQQKIFSQFEGSFGFATLVLASAVLIIFLTDLVVSYVLDGANTPFGEGLDFTVHIFFLLKQAYDIYNDVATTVQLAQALAAADDTLSFGEALVERLSSDSALIGASRLLSVVGLILSAAVAIGVFLYAVASGKAISGAALGAAFAATIAAIVVAVTLFVLSLTVVGAILVAIVLFVDAILLLAGVKWTITSEITEVLTGVIFHEDLIETLDPATGSLQLTLAEPAKGIIATNPISFSFPITTTMTEVENGTDADQYTYVMTQMVYSLSNQTQDQATIGENGTYPTVWHNHNTKDTWRWFSYNTVDFSQTVPLGINAVVPLTLNTYYEALAENCWWFIIESCSVQELPGTTATDLGDAVILDALPPTLNEFMDITNWTSGDLALVARDADGDGLRAVTYGGADVKDQLWDQDGDKLSDGYELNANGRPASEGGVDLDVASKDTDADGLHDNIEMRWGTNPGKADTDDDGLEDEEELPPSSTWSIAYAYDPNTGTITDARVWSDPNRSDGDGDGMSDLFEQTQNTLTSTPWADPNNPRVYNPNVWNESPVALYVSDDSTEGYVRPGATVVYTTSTANNLSNGQELVGELSLKLPSTVSGSPLSKTVDIESGDSEALVSTLNFEGTSSQSYQLSSAMSLTDFDQTRWSWEESTGATRNGFSGTPLAAAIAQTANWEGPYVVATREQLSDGKETIGAYITRSDGSTVEAQEMLLPQDGYVPTDPAVACNDSGACLLLWGGNFGDPSKNLIAGNRLEKNLANSTALHWNIDGAISNVSIASDGTDFMVAWVQGGQNVKVARVPVASGVGSPTQVATVSGTNAATAIAWTGKSYTIFWTGDGNIHQAAVSTGGEASNASVLGTGSGWPQSDGSVHPPVIAYDDISGQALVAYRSPSGELAARRVVDGSGDEFILSETGVSGDNVTVALSADPKNSGWAVAWTPAAGSEVEYRAISPLGDLRGEIGLIDESTVTALALTCQPPRSQLLLEFNEDTGSTTFADSSGNNRTTTCSEGCPVAGVTGRFGNAASFNGSSQALAVNGIALNSFTVATWLRRGDIGRFQLIATTGGATLRLGFNSNDTLFCNFGGSDSGVNSVTSKAVYVDELWHHYACTFDATGKRIAVYRDGVAVASATTAQTYSGDKTFYIGRSNNSDSENISFNGEMDNFMVVDRAMTAAEMADVFEDAIAVFDLDEPSGAARFINAVPDGLDGSCTGDKCPTMGVEGVAYTAAEFGGQQSIEIVGAESNAIKTYTWNFEEGKTTDWSSSTGGSPSVSMATRAGSPTKFIDYPNYDNSRQLLLNLSDLPAHNTIKLSYDLYVLGSDWRGSRTDLTNSSSFFNGLADNKSILGTSFSNASAGTIGEYQLYPAFTDSSVSEKYVYDGITYYLDGTSRYSACSGSNFMITVDYSMLNQNGIEFSNNVSCINIQTDAAAHLYSNTNYGGAAWLVDPGRSQRPEYANNDLESIRVWPAAFYPKHGSTNESLTVGNINNANTAIYRVEQTFSHSEGSLELAFNGKYQFGLDNVTVAAANSGTNILLKNSSFTLSAWAKTASATSAGEIITQGPEQANQGLRFGISGSGTASCSFWGNDLKTMVTPDTAWHHWVCTYDAANKKRTLYRDGVQIAQDTATSNYVGEGPTYLGSGFEGTIDEVGIWTAPLSANAVQDLYQKVKIEDESVLTCQMPLTQNDAKIAFGELTLRETTTRLGDVNQTLNRTITVDADKPAASIASGYFSQSAPGPYASSDGSLVIAGIAEDPTSFVSQVSIQPPGEAMTPTVGTESWSYSWYTSHLMDGPQQVVIEATDAVGNTSSPETWYTILDTVPPTTAFALASTTIRPPRNTAGRWLVPLTGSVSDPTAGGQAGSGVASVQVLLKGQGQLTGLGWQQATLSDGDTWQLDYVMPVFGASGQSVPDPTGVYTAILRASDKVTNTTPADSYPAIVISVDADAPAVAASITLSNTSVIADAMEIDGSIVTGDTVQSVEINFVPGAQMGALNGTLLSLPMDENLASEYFVDQSGAGHAATCQDSACPTVGQSGQHDLAFQFDGADDTLSVADINLSNQSFTLGAWSKRDMTNAGLYIVSQGTSSANRGLQFGFRPDNAFTCAFWSDDLTTTETYSTTGWHHWVCTYDAESKQRTIYRDGIAVTQNTATADFQGSGLLYVGSEFGSSRYFAGLIDQVTVHPRALAAYEVANLHAYGQNLWQAASLDSNSWHYQIQDGDNGIEGAFQINVRGTDAVGNSTPQGGQRVWRGEIDTKPPSVSAPVTITTAGSQVTTSFECNTTDFSLDDDTSCTVDWDPPKFRDSDRTFTNYGDVNLWYGATFTETQRLYAIAATSIYTKETPVPDINVTACDKYNHCTTVPSDVHRETVETLAATPLYPLPGDVLTSLEPIQVRGHTFVANDLATMVVKIDGAVYHRQSWLDGTPVDEAWTFSWRPPRSGIYTIQPVIHEWPDRAPRPNSEGAADVLDMETRSGDTPDVELPISVYLPLILGSGDPIDGNYRIFLPTIASATADYGGIPGPASIVYVDLEAPTIAIEPTVLRTEHKRGRHGVLLTGPVSDDTLVKTVETSVDGGPWQLATIGEDGAWRHIWVFDRLIDGETVEVSVRATDVAGRTTNATESVFIDVVAPTAGVAGLFYINLLGEPLPVSDNVTSVQASAIGLSWEAAQSDNPLTYEVGFSRQLRIRPEQLTRYDSPGEASHEVKAGERWYATIRYVDDVGNADVAVLGPLFIGSGRQ